MPSSAKLTAALPPKRITAIINLWGLALSTPMGIYMALQFDFCCRGQRHVVAVAAVRAGCQHVDRVAVDDGAAHRARLRKAVFSPSAAGECRPHRGAAAG
jgi:hypothetical protein